MEAIVGEDQKGQRLDSAVATAMPNLSRAFIQKLCADGKITVNGKSEKPGYKLKLDDKVLVQYDADTELRPPDIDLPIIYEDEDCVVINKPAGVLTHAQHRLSGEATVATFLRQRVIPSSEDWGNGERIGIVHRLDRATSGVIICAKNQKALSYLQQQFAKRKAHKTYTALVEGHLRQPEALIDLPIERNPRAPATFRVGQNGKSAQTHYIVVREGEHGTLLTLHPKTGRTHQLRVQMAHLGHPIIGDPLYGHGTFGDRLYLHASELTITLPNGKEQTFTAPLPAEFETDI